MQNILKRVNIIIYIMITLCIVTAFTCITYADSSGETQVYYDLTLKTSSLGNYEVAVKAYERPSHEVLPIISADYFPTSESKYKTEIDNTEPSATYKANTVSKVDVIFAIGKLSQQATLESYIPTFTNRLQAASNNIDAQVQQVETTEIGFGGDFKWELSGGGDGTGPRISFGDAADGSWIFFGGYEVAGPRDGAWMPLPATGKLSISFDVDASMINSHPGGDFVFRFGSAETHADSGDWAEVWVSLRGSGYREKSGFNQSLNSGTRFRLGVTANAQSGEVTITVNGVTVVERTGVKLSANSLFPYFQHGSHGCDTISQTRISGIKMEIANQKTLGDAISDVQWRDGSARFIIHATDIVPEETVPGKEDEFSYTVTKLLNSNAYLINLGTPINKSSLDKLLSSIIAANGTIKGTYYNNNPIIQAMNNSADYIYNIVKNLSKPTDWVLVNTDILWNTEYKDNERDVPLNFGEHDGTRKQPQDKSDITLASSWGIPLTHYYNSDKSLAEKWRYKHAPTFYDNSNIQAGFNDIWIIDPIESFENPGKYRINYKRRDNPLNPNVSLADAFDSYRYWSTDYDRED